MVNFYAFTITVVFYRSSVITVYNCLLTEVHTRYSTLNNDRLFMLRWCFKFVEMDIFQLAEYERSISFTIEVVKTNSVMTMSVGYYVSCTCCISITCNKNEKCYIGWQQFFWFVLSLSIFLWQWRLTGVTKHRNTYLALNGYIWKPLTALCQSKIKDYRRIFDMCFVVWLSLVK